MLQDPDDTVSSLFALESVEETAAPEGAGGGKWYSYTIGRGSLVINCKRSGSLQSVKEHAQGVVDELNERSRLYGSKYASRRKTKQDTSGTWQKKN